jgi:hypothetical protein
MSYLMEVPAGHAPRRTGTIFVTRFHPGVSHDHRPTGRWADVQRDSQARCQVLQRRAVSDPRGIPGIAEALAVECACANASPQGVASIVQNTLMRVLPLARRHLAHYLAGSGAPLTIDLEDVIRRDGKFRAKLAAHVRRATKGNFKVNQSDYGVKDFQFAFGAIDRLDFEVSPAAGRVHVWFQDRYEWHPVGFGYSSLPGDIRRPSNCVHAAMVELKSAGAKDYWMIGDAVVPLSLLSGGSAPRSRHTGTTDPGERPPRSSSNGDPAPRRHGSMSYREAVEEAERRLGTLAETKLLEPYLKAMEEAERKQREVYLRDCANVTVLETLEREARTPAERVKRLERKVAAMPRIVQGHALIRDLMARRRAGRLSDAQLRAALMGVLHAFPELSEFPFPSGYAVGSVADEVARARCELSRARWELLLWNTTGRVPGRLLR